MFQKEIRYSKRFQEIVNVLIKNGLSHLLYRIGIRNKKISPHRDEDYPLNKNLVHLGEKLRLALQELGPTFIKLGQIASTRRDIVPEEIGKELEKLQDDVQAFSFEEVEKIFLEEFEQSTKDLFASFTEEPLATASIGQVHKAELYSGETVAIKIQRPNIKQTMETDLDILFHLGRLIEERTKWGKTYRILDMIDEFSTSLRHELNYIMEGRNADRISEQFTDDATIHIPTIFWDYTSVKVLTMEMIDGIKVTKVDQLRNEGYDLPLIADRIANSLLTQVLDYGLFHGDPHPGNIYILPNNVVAYLDFGLVGRLNEQMKNHFASLIIAVEQRSPDKMIDVFQQMNLLDNVENLQPVRRDLDNLLIKYYEASLTEISLGQLLVDIFAIAYRHQIDIPSDITILAKAILTAEEIIEQLDPTYSIMKVVESFAVKIMRKRYDPRNIVKRAVKASLEDLDTIRKLPKDVQQTVNAVKRGRLRMNLNIEEASSFLKRLDKISNRLSFSIILLSFSILMVGLIIGASISGQSNLLFRLPIIELGSVVATIMFLFMLFAIFRSGRM